jgi:hypothetical protein
MSNDHILSNPRYKDIVASIQQLEEIGGVCSTEEYIAILNAVKTEIDSRIGNAKASNPGPRLNDATREEVVAFLKDCVMSCSFGDGLEDDYVIDGVSMVGLNNMTDTELVEELLLYTGEEEELYIKAESELSVEEMLTDEDPMGNSDEPKVWP